MNQEVTIKITKKYGRVAIYPINEQGQLFSQLAGTKTLSRQQIKLIEKLGYAVKVDREAL